MIIPRLEVAVVRAGVQGFSPAALRRARGRQHLSLRQLSLLSGVSFATISEWETSRALPPPSHLAAVANALGITVADVVPIKETHLVLADLRHHAGLTQQAAADAVGLKRSMYRAIDTGTRAADAQQRTQHAQLYSITTNQFDTLWQRTRDTHIARLKRGSCAPATLSAEPGNHPGMGQRIRCSQ